MYAANEREIMERILSKNVEGCMAQNRGQGKADKGAGQSMHR